MTIPGAERFVMTNGLLIIIALVVVNVSTVRELTRFVDELRSPSVAVLTFNWLTFAADVCGT